MQDIVSSLKEQGATLVALTPQTENHSQTLVDKHKLTFDLLSDPGNAYASELGLRFVVDEGTKGVYEGFGLDIPSHNGDDSWSLPIPARLVVDGSGIVKTADIGLDYTHRPEPQKTVDDVRAL